MTASAPSLSKHIKKCHNYTVKTEWLFNHEVVTSVVEQRRPK